MEIRTLFISDVHLGTKKSQANKLLDVLKTKLFEIYLFSNLAFVKLNGA